MGEMSEDNRHTYLLKEVARALDRHINPFSHAWLRERGVTLDEYEALSNSIAAVLMGYIAAPQETRKALMRAYASRTMMEVMG